jgi:hypothetical protein
MKRHPKACHSPDDPRFNPTTFTHRFLPRASRLGHAHNSISQDSSSPGLSRRPMNTCARRRGYGNLCLRGTNVFMGGRDKPGHDENWRMCARPPRFARRRNLKQSRCVNPAGFNRRRNRTNQVHPAIRRSGNLSCPATACPCGHRE